MSPLVLIFLKSAVYPAVAAAVLFLLFGNRREPWRSGIQALVMAGAFIVGFYVLLGNPHFFPRDVNESLVWCALILMGYVWVAPQGEGVRYVLRGFFVLVLSVLVLWHIRGSTLNLAHARSLVAFFCLALGVWSIVERSATHVRTLTLTALPIVTGAALSLVFLFSGSALLSQLLSIWCVLLSAVAVAALISPKRVSPLAVVPFGSVLLIVFMIVGRFYLDINPWHLIALCWPFGLLWIRPWIPAVPKAPLGEALVLGVLSVLPLAYLVWEMYRTAGPLY